MRTKLVGKFFDALTDDYTATIERCFPRYREMLWAVLDYLPSDFRPQRILELGSGTGNLSVLTHARYPNASFVFVDLSTESLDSCRKRLGESPSLKYEAADFNELNFPAGEFDIVVSSISIHHLESEQKRQLFSRVHEWLTPSGIFSFADQCAGASTDLYQRHIDNWKTISLEAGSDETEWQMWMDHQNEHDHHDTLVDQLRWLKNAGFGTVDCTWRYLLWSAVQARKAA